MEGLVDRLFGSGTDLDALQMIARAVAIFVLALAMIRASGRRSFGQSRPFDACTTVLLGAVLSRAVVGASPFWPTVCAGVAIVALHRLVGLASLRWPRFERLVSGDQRELIRAGARDADEMRKGLITPRDLDEAIRCKTGDEHAQVERAILERDGKISVKTAGRAQGTSVATTGLFKIPSVGDTYADLCQTGKHRRHPTSDERPSGSEGDVPAIPEARRFRWKR